MLQEGFGLDQTKACPAGYSLMPELCDELRSHLLLCWEIQKGKKVNISKPAEVAK